MIKTSPWSLEEGFLEVLKWYQRCSKKIKIIYIFFGFCPNPPPPPPPPLSLVPPSPKNCLVNLLHLFAYFSLRSELSLVNIFLLICNTATLLTHFISLVPFYLRENIREPMVFSGYREKPVAWNGLIKPKGL